MKSFFERVLGRRDPVERAIPTIPESPAALAQADSRANVIEALRQRVADGSRGRLDPGEIHPDGQLFDRGYLDSFSYVEFLAFIEHTYSVRIDDSQLAGRLSTISAMADHILQGQRPHTA